MERRGRACVISLSPMFGLPTLVFRLRHQRGDDSSTINFTRVDPKDGVRLITLIVEVILLLPRVLGGKIKYW